MADRHLDRRQVLRALLLGGAGLAVPAACGLPTGGHAIIDGPAKTTQPGSGFLEHHTKLPVLTLQLAFWTLDFGLTAVAKDPIGGGRQGVYNQGCG